MKTSTRIAAVVLALLFMAGTADAYYHNAEKEAREQRSRNQWIDQERARQEQRAFDREQEKILYDAQSGMRFLEGLEKQDGLYKRSEGLFDLNTPR